MHDVEQRDALVRRGPEDAWPEHEIAVPDEAHTEPSIFLVGERSAERGGRYVADARSTPPADVVVVTIRSPQLL